MILMITPENTWNPWKPVMKKKKSANNLLPYSFLCKLAPSITILPSANLFSDSALDKIILCFGEFNVGFSLTPFVVANVSGELIVSILINKSGCDLKPA